MQEGVLDFGSSDELLKFLKERVDDIDKAVINCCDEVGWTYPDGRRVGPISTKDNDIGMVLCLVTNQQAIVSKADATMLLNDGLLNRMNIRIEVV